MLGNTSYAAYGGASDRVLDRLSVTGGFNSRYGSPIAEPTSFDEKTVDSYEVGFKSDFWQNRAHIKAALIIQNIATFKSSYLILEYLEL